MKSTSFYGFVAAVAIAVTPLAARFLEPIRRRS